MEGLKVYDKAENGTMLAAELAHVLLSHCESERLNDAECEDILRSCGGTEDDDGFIKYERKGYFNRSGELKMNQQKTLPILQTGVDRKQARKIY
ncbi:myosin light chain alkali [Caerostris extrusa]|uniref:Myosin light chain alkali n=1 Tax=Caerostris extrusa TaxID=172846 RepID=A0AAV4MIL2_CAEEX|nr:myosin light chain alkali [Caerostris extrusa]